MIQLRYYQSECKPALIKYHNKNPKGHPIIALPTGSGKTYAIADIVKWMVEQGDEVVVLSHVKEILEQNYKSLRKYLNMPIGVNSSMLGKREKKQVTVAGIQSVFRQPDTFKNVKWVIIDEAHLVPFDEDTMYQKFFAGIPGHIRIGFTATPFRLGHGYIYSQSPAVPFDACIVDYCTKEKYSLLVKQGFIAPLTTKRTKMEMDTDGIKLIGGEFSDKDLAERFDRDKVTNEAIKEIIAAGDNRKRWLIFAIDINHAEHIAEMLIRNGIPTAPVHSKMNKLGFDRDKTVKESKDGKYKCVVNVNILTTGYDDPDIDLIALLRPTNSPVLHVQTLGRGGRISENKDNCLVLDFAGNTSRLGPINDPLVKKKGKGKEGGEPITKTCPECDSIIAPAVRICPDCGHKFKFEHGLSATAITAEVMDDGKDHWVNVEKVTYKKNPSAVGPSSVVVSYKCAGKNVNEWVCVEHKGFAKQKADHWVKYRGGEKSNTCEALMSQVEKLNKPKQILLRKQGKYYLIKDARF